MTLGPGGRRALSSLRQPCCPIIPIGIMLVPYRNNVSSVRAFQIDDINLRREEIWDASIILHSFIGLLLAGDNMVSRLFFVSVTSHKQKQQ